MTSARTSASTTSSAWGSMRGWPAASGSAAASTPAARSAISASSSTRRACTSYDLGDFGTQTATTIDGEPICRVVTPFSSPDAVEAERQRAVAEGRFVVSGVFQDMSGPAIEAVWAAHDARDRSVAGPQPRGRRGNGQRAAGVPQTLFEGRIRRLDLRLTKIFQLTTERVRLQANLDAYNALNSSAVQTCRRRSARTG